MINQLKNIKNSVATAKKAFGAYKGSIVILALLGFLSGILEGIGVNALIPFLSLVTNDSPANSTGMMRIMTEFFSTLGLALNLQNLLIFICALFVLKALVLLVFTYIKTKITTHYEQSTRAELFKNALLAGWPYLLEQKIGHLEKVLMHEVDQAVHFLNHISVALLVLTNLAIYTVVAFNISAPITAVSILFGAILFFFFVPFARKTKRYAQETMELSRTISHHVNESMVGAKAIKALNQENKTGLQGESYFKNYRNLRIKFFMIRSVNGIFLQPISLIFIGILFSVFYTTNNFELPVFFATIYLIQNIFQYVEKGESLLHRINETTPYVRHLLAIQEETQKNKELEVGTEAFSFKHSITFNNVTFKYPTSQDRILDSLSFSVAKGESIGIIGPSGAGKTTIVDLLLRLFVQQSGSITVDGKPLDTISLKEWRTHIGYVSHDLFLKNDTIANNIRFSNAVLTDKDVEEAARQAHLLDFILSLPNKFETLVGERGIHLSAGQRQRLILARVLATKPELIILDEATSALDNESEHAIQQSLEALKGKITMITVAHRLATVTSCDRLLVIEKGQVVETGTPTELMTNKNSYFYKVSHVRA